MAHFIVTYHRKTGTTQVDRFEDAFDAFDEFSDRERALIADTDVEVVLLSAAHEDDLRITHPNFFGDGDLLPA
jgi:hypothetical protein